MRWKIRSGYQRGRLKTEVPRHNEVISATACNSVEALRKKGFPVLLPYSLKTGVERTV